MTSSKHSTALPPKGPALSRNGLTALGYASKGWLVFPLQEIIEGTCSCGRKCSSPGKHPRTANGVLDATLDSDQIFQWWKQWPAANIGVATGHQSGIVVLDIDPRHDGFDSWNDLIDLYGPVDSLEGYTGGAGTHVYFTAPDAKLRNSAGAIGPGIDTRAEGGYVVAPPSVHASGESYDWITRQLPSEVPAWLLERWPRHQSEAGSRNTGGQASSEKTHAWVILNNPIREGQRNETLTRLAGWLRSFHPEHVVSAMVQGWNLGLCEPPLPKEEVQAIVKSVFRYAQRGVNGHPKAIVNPWRHNEGLHG